MIHFKFQPQTSICLKSVGPIKCSIFHGPFRPLDLRSKSESSRANRRAMSTRTCCFHKHFTTPKINNSYFSRHDRHSLLKHGQSLYFQLVGRSNIIYMISVFVIDFAKNNLGARNILFPCNMKNCQAKYKLRELDLHFAIGKLLFKTIKDDFTNRNKFLQSLFKIHVHVNLIFRT